MWAGIALGVAAALEVPALLLIGRLSNRFSHLGLIATSCLAGIGYYLGLAFATGPIMLVGLQLLNTWSFAGIAGIGLPLFQHMIPRPGLSTDLYMNTRRIGSIVSGPSSRSALSPCSANAASSLPAPFSPSSAWPSSPLPAEPRSPSGHRAEDQAVEANDPNRSSRAAGSSQINPSSGMRLVRGRFV